MNHQAIEHEVARYVTAGVIQRTDANRPASPATGRRGHAGCRHRAPGPTTLLLTCVFAATLHLQPAVASPPLVQFDTGPTASCRVATPKKNAVTDPQHRLVQATLHVSALVSQPLEQRKLEYLYEIVNPTGSIQITDYNPKTELGSDVAGNIGVEKKKESTKSLGMNVSGTFEHFVRASGVGDMGAKDSLQLHYELKPRQSAILAAGTVQRGTGVYFKLRASSDSSLEGQRDFMIVMRVPTKWRADMVYLRCEVRDMGGGKPRVVNTASFVIGLYVAGDDEAMRAAETLIQTEAVLRRTVANRQQEIERQSMRSIVHRLGAMLDLYKPRIPKSWLARVIYGPTAVVRDDFTRRLPDDVEQCVLDYIRAKQRVYQLSGKRLLIMALSRNSS